MSTHIIEQALKQADALAKKAKLSTAEQEALRDKKHRAILESLDNEPNSDDEALSLHQQMAGVQLSLSDYLAAVKLVIDDSFDHEVWVRAEIRAINSKGGHYYLELAEKDDAGSITASCRATLWRFKAGTVLTKFTAKTGQQLSAGTSVLIQCKASFHAQYGFSLTISDIDPTYTLGELAAAYQAMKKRLIDEDLLHKNKRFPAPFDIQHAIVIAPEKAAGLGDFRAEADRLAAANACQFHYHHATFQGNHAPEEIRTAIMTGMVEFTKTHGALPDLLIIIRGGGAVGDLAYLNDYELAALVAESPVPVWVGIGHERDSVILDEVAHSSFDTPSKVILAVEKHLVNMVNAAKDEMTTIKNLADAAIMHAKQMSARHIERIQNNARKQLIIAKKDSHYQLKHLQQTLYHQAQRQRQLIKDKLTVVQKSSITQLTAARHASKTLLMSHHSVFKRLDEMRTDCRHLQSLILIQHPARTQARGYAIVYDSAGKPIQSAAKLNSNQSVSIAFHDGQAAATINGISLKPSTQS